MTAPAKARFSAVDVALVVMSFVWGLNFTAVKGALADFQPLTFNAIRFGTSSLFLLGVLWLRERSIGVHRKDLARFIMLAIIGNTAYQLFFINGIALTTATNSALILATTPIFVILFGALLDVEKVTSRVVQGVILSFLGVVMIVLGSGNTLTFSDQSLLGDLLIVANPICWSIYTVLSKPMLKEYSPLKLTAVTMAIGAVPLVIVAIPSLNQQNWTAISMNSWLGLGIFGVLRYRIRLRHLVHWCQPNRQRTNLALRQPRHGLRLGVGMDSAVGEHDCRSDRRRGSCVRQFIRGETKKPQQARGNI